MLQYPEKSRCLPKPDNLQVYDRLHPSVLCCSCNAFWATQVNVSEETGICIFYHRFLSVYAGLVTDGVITETLHPVKLKTKVF